MCSTPAFLSLRYARRKKARVTQVQHGSGGGGAALELKKPTSRAVEGGHHAHARCPPPVVHLRGSAVGVVPAAGARAGKRGARAKTSKRRSAGRMWASGYNGWCHVAQPRAAGRIILGVGRPGVTGRGLWVPATLHRALRVAVKVRAVYKCR